MAAKTIKSMVNISFIGDIGLNDHYINLTDCRINPFAALDPFLKNTHLLVGNLECVLKGNGENYHKKPRISTTPEALMNVKHIRLGLATLATNHVYDNLEDGLQKTLEFLDGHHIAGMGASLVKEDASKPYIFTKNDLSFCFLNYITRDTNPSLPDQAGVYLNEFSLDRCIADLADHSNNDFRIVLMHWGGRFEGGLYPDYDQPELARKLIDHGADLIIGHHSHTLQPYEKYKGKYIFYSLGNFCFSDINFEGKIRKMSSRRERESVIVCARFDKQGYELSFVPVRNEQLILKVRRIVLLKWLWRNICFFFLKFKPLWYLYKFSFMKIRPVMIQITRKDPERSRFQRLIGQLRKTERDNLLS
jgi:poly-gamma-glutamate capsule biosynthesis protein CapA/YwtB (metallophosphatase superfamily)